MKRTTLLTVLFVFTVAFSHAKVWRLNNNPGADADFTTAQATHDDAGVLAGDTIHVEASATSYGALNTTKRLVWIGNGYFLGTGTNDNDSLQATPTSSSLGTVIFNVGSDSSSYSGLSFSTCSFYANNVFIKRCHFVTNSYFYGNLSNLVFSQNYISGFVIEQTPGSKTNLLFTNNIFVQYIRFSSNDAGILENNVIHTGAAYSTIITGFVVRNNIMYLGAFSCTTCTQQNNIGSGVQFPTGNGNQQNITMSTVFELAGSTDGKWKLKTGSPAIAAGVGGVDCGAYGGPAPYKLSGIPNIPSIYYLNTGTVINNNMLNVNLSTRSNN